MQRHSVTARWAKSRQTPRLSSCASAAVRVGREVKGRAGKGVTTVTGLPMSLSDIESLATRLKKRCGSGGTVREGVIEIQGDHRDTVVAELVKLGWPAKKSGG